MVGSDAELRARKVAIWAIICMTGIWIVLSYLSFIDSGDRVRPRTVKVEFQGINALKGKQVFQSYNCMDCHTIVGNGAYFAPDLTKLYEMTGPAWLRAYLGSPGTYPTKTIVNVQLQDLIKKGEELPKKIDDYLELYPGALNRVDKRGGIEALMPNLQFTAEEIDALIAYMKYTAMINTAGWPPEVIATDAVIESESRRLEEKSGLISSVTAAIAPVTDDESGPTDIGLSLAKDFGCTACHSSDGSVQIGPSFKGLYGSKVELDDGRVVEADDQYIMRSITHPNEAVVKGFTKGVMPSFEEIMSEDDVTNLTEYIKSLK